MRQWDLTDPVAGIRAPTAWDGSTGEGVVVAVLDTGYVDHGDLAANIVPGYDFISWYGQTLDGDVYPDIAGDGDGRDGDAHDAGDWLDGSEQFCGSRTSSSSWHGTHVAGTVAAVTNNAVRHRRRGLWGEGAADPRARPLRWPDLGYRRRHHLGVRRRRRRSTGQSDPGRSAEPEPGRFRLLQR